jgi:hypothetical protein
MAKLRRRSKRALKKTRARRSAKKEVVGPKLRKVILQTQTAPGAEYRRVCELARKLPGVEESSSYGTPALKVKGRFLCRLRSEAEGALAIRCDFLERQMLLQADPGVFFVTDHYLDYPMILVRLDRVRLSALPDLIERAWRMVASPKLIAEHDARHRLSSPSRPAIEGF